MQEGEGRAVHLVRFLERWSNFANPTPDASHCKSGETTDPQVGNAAAAYEVRGLREWLAASRIGGSLLECIRSHFFCSLAQAKVIRFMRNRILKISAAVAVVLIIALLGAALYIRSELRGSLAQLDGELKTAGLSGPVTIERDAQGIPTIRGKDRLDVAFALGFVHGQERYFQMDLLRRNSAGELAELFGAGPEPEKAILKNDQRLRVYRFRDVAQKLLAKSTEQEVALLNHYADGVNAGLASLKTKPFEYLLLSADPKPWTPEDSALVMFSMYLDLQGEDFRDEATLGLLHDVLPEPMFQFVAPLGTEWDAPIDGPAFSVPATPGPEVFDARKLAASARSKLAPLGSLPLETSQHLGSNNWAVSGKRTADGRAMVADDMHLGLRVPHVWYRASLAWDAPSDSAKESEAPVTGVQSAGDTAAHKPVQASKQKQMTGASLPGTPAIVVGSNGHVAWGFTNAEGDWVDVVLIEVDPTDKDRYLTPDGPRKFEHAKETIHVKGEEDEKLDVVSTIWGPVIDHDHRNRPRAIHWVALEPGGANMGLLAIESAETLEEAIRLANLSGSPAQNFVVADDKGRIAWTILGRIPRRVGFDGRLPSSWADGTHKWDGWLTPEEYPKVIDPESGQIWTANARVVSGDMLAKLGDGGYDLGARAKQIRDDLTELDKATEADMLKVQLDDRAVFLEPWQKLLLGVLTPEAIQDDSRRGEMRKYVEEWGGRASPDSVGFRLVRTYRRLLIAQLSDLLIAPCKEIDKQCAIYKMDRTEGPVWRMVSERPAHLLAPRCKSWDDLLLTAADEVLSDAHKDEMPLSKYTWGNHNTTKIQHPISMARAILSGPLDMPARPVSGDSENLPRIQAPSMGASQRMAVSPGHEADAYFHMPCGQSGHPMSPHYCDGHSAWEKGQPTPFMPGEVKYTLKLLPCD